MPCRPSAKAYYIYSPGSSYQGFFVHGCPADQEVLKIQGEVTIMNKRKKWQSNLHWEKRNG